jgi:hypothetical protein
MIDIMNVTKVEICNFKTEADMYIYEIYLINKLKPLLNRDDKAFDEVTISLPEVDFKEHVPKLMESWKKKILEAEKEAEQQRQKEEERFEAKREARRRLKGEDYFQWLEDNGY